MYEYLSGRVVDLGEDYLVIDINGIGFKLLTSKNTIMEIKLNENYKVYTRFIIRDDNAILYGFSNKYELELFNLLTTVSGIGPKAAISLLSSFKAKELISAIAFKNAKELTAAQGIGKKLAERIILELKDKVEINLDIPDEIIRSEDGNIIQAIEALTSLGYNYTEAKESVMKIENKKQSLDALIKEALKQLSKIR